MPSPIRALWDPPRGSHAPEGDCYGTRGSSASCWPCPSHHHSAWYLLCDVLFSPGVCAVPWQQCRVLIILACAVPMCLCVIASGSRSAAALCLIVAPPSCCSSFDPVLDDCGQQSRDRLLHDQRDGVVCFPCSGIDSPLNVMKYDGAHILGDAEGDGVMEHHAVGVILQSTPRPELL